MLLENASISASSQKEISPLSYTKFGKISESEK